MKPLFQDCQGSIPEIAGRICETLLCVQVKDDEDESLTPVLFWLKLQDGLWHRFYIDHYVCCLCWEEYEELNQHDLEDEDFPVENVGENFGLCDHKIMKVEMTQSGTETEREGCLRIYFDEGRMLVHNVSEEVSRLTII